MNYQEKVAQFVKSLTDKSNQNLKEAV